MISSVLVETGGKVDCFKSEVFHLGEVEGEGKVGHFKSEVSRWGEGGEVGYQRHQFMFEVTNFTPVHPSPNKIENFSWRT